MIHRTSFLMTLGLIVGCAGESSLKGSSSSEGGKQENSSEASAEPSAENDDETRVMPPEVVSGAYLTCSVDESQARVVFGCNAFAADGRKQALPKAQTTWKVLTSAGLEVAAEVVELASFDHAWIIARAVAEAGVVGQAVVTQESGTLTVKQRHVANEADPVMVYELR